MAEQVSLFDQDTWSGKMSPEHSVPTKEKISQRSSKRQSGSQNRKPPLFLCLKKDGPQADASWETNGALLGEFSMHSFGEHPSAAVESHLSQILEVNPHQRYYLSAKACQGILNRASRRGQKLPEMLEKALVEQSLAPSKSEEDAVGGGKGALIQTDKSATLSTLQDQTLFQPVVSLQGSMIGRADHNGPQGDGVNEDVSFTLNTTDRHAVCYNIGSYHSNAWKSDNPHSGIYEADKSKTLDALQCGYPGCNQGGTAVVETFLGNGSSVAGTLMANAGTKLWLGNQEAFSGAYHIVERRMGVHYIVRRLTPLECERLQGFPDGWTDIGELVDSKGKKHKEADSPRYKALGNSIAIPPWKWVLKRLCACYERDATMASLFDGIGGFPYIWEQINGKRSCLWASEIEEFPMAVTRIRFGEGQ